MEWSKKQAPAPEQSNNFLDSNGGTINANTVANFFDRSVTKIKDNNGNVATRAENGYFYLPGRSGQKAFYLARGESASVLEVSRSKLNAPLSARRAIIRETRANLGVLRTEGAMERATESSQANQKMVLGIAKDLNGRIIEGGLFGALFGGPKRQQWLASIENDYPQARGRLLPLIEQGFENAAWDSAKSGNAKHFINFMKRTGRSFGSLDEARVRQIVAAPSTIKDRQEAIVETLMVGAVSHILTGGVSILLGKIRTPIPLHKADLPSKEAITRSLHGEGAREQAQAAHNDFWDESEKMRITTGATEKAKRLYGTSAAYVLSAIEEFGAQIDVSSNWLTSGVKKGRAKNLQRAQEFGPWDTQKTLASIKFKPGSPEEARRMSLLEKLNQTQIVRGLAESGSETGRYNKMLNMMSGCGTEEIFLEKYVLPSEAIYGPNVRYIRQAIHAFYHGGSAPYLDKTTGRDIPSYKYERGDQEAIYSLVNSKYTPGVVKMIDAYTTNPEAWKAANDRTTGGGRNVFEKSTAYSRELLKHIDITNPNSVAQVFRNSEINHKSIADTYSENISNIQGIDISPNALIRAIERGKYGRIAGFNTTRLRRSPGQNNFDGEAFIFLIPETSGKYRVCAIKKDCANLIIGGSVTTPESYLDNLRATVYFKMPLIINLKPSSKAKKPEKPGEPTEPNPEVPGPTPENPPTTPGTPIENPPIITNPGATPGTGTYPDAPDGGWINSGGDIPTQGPINITQDPT